MLSLIWLHTGTMVCCTSSNQNVARATTIYLPGRIRPASKTPLKRPKKQMLSLVWLHTGTMVCCTSSNQNVARATTIYLPGQNRPVEFDRPQKTFKTAPKRNVKPGRATYGYYVMLYKF